MVLRTVVNATSHPAAGLSAVPSVVAPLWSLVKGLRRSGVVRAAVSVVVIHSHPHGERCFYYFPGTQVATSDAASFAQQPYAVDAIMCGDRVVWINRDMAGQDLQLTEHPTPPAPERAQR